MSNVFTLDSVREAAEKKFAPYKLELDDGTVVTLKHLLRLNERTRKEVLTALDTLKGDDDESADGTEHLDKMIAATQKILDRVADNGKVLVKALDGDLALIISVIEGWMEATQVGEAENSPAS